MSCAMGDNCCKVKGPGSNSKPADKEEETTPQNVYDASQEPIFPPELKVTQGYHKVASFSVAARDFQSSS